MPKLFSYSGQTPTDQYGIDQKRKLAQMLTQMSVTPNQNAMNSGNAIIAALAQIAPMIAAKRADKQAREGIDAMNADRSSELSKIIAAGKGSPAQPGQPFVDEQAQFMGQESPEGLKSTPDVAAVPGGREAMINAMMGSKLPEFQNLGLQKSIETPKGTWSQVEGPRGSLLQRNSETGEMKSVVGTTDPTLMQMLLQQQGGRPDASRDPNAPWKNITDPKKQDEARMRFGANADARLAKEQEETDKSQGMINALDRFQFLNEQNKTGGAFKIPGSQAIATATSDEYSEMKSLTDLMTPQMRQGMPGAASDRDVAMFRGATVGLDKPREANYNIATGLKAAHQNKIDRANFLAQYVTQYGHDRGADSEWRKYLNANPIFDQSAKSGSYKLNQNRMNYQDWFKSGGKQIEGPAKQATPVTGGAKFLGFE